MKKAKRFLLTRGMWYIAGFFLFYAPFAFFQRLLVQLFPLKARFDIHDICFRMGFSGLLTGKGLEILTFTGISVVLMVITAFLIGPIFCGKLCTAGALPEYLSRLTPDKLKINWQKHIDPVPVRYGVLTGFLVIPSLGLSVNCAYCNYSFLQRIVTGVQKWDLGVMGSATILTAFVWLVVLGLFAKGGRGYCSYLCPIGAIQSLIHSVGSKIGFTYKLKLASDKCLSCGNCVKECPMGALKLSDQELSYQRLNCLTCNQCVHSCPKTALSFGRGKDGWQRLPEVIEQPGVVVE